MLAALLASSQLAVYAGVIWRNLNFKKEIEKVLYLFKINFLSTDTGIILRRMKPNMTRG